jgi:phosphatidylethanolamine-binding protein (PEBP) family uncharacterized protein
MLSVFFGKTLVKGQQLDRAKTIIQPSVNISGEKTRYYTIIISDSDARYGDFLHWLVVNIDSSRYQEIVSYYPPKSTSEAHRYNIYLCEQETKLDIEPFDRNIFDIRDFIDMQLLHLKDSQFFTVKG